MRHPIFCVVMLVCLSSSLSADVITTRNGRDLKGAILADNVGEISIKTEIGTLRVKRADIVSVTREDTTPEEVDGDSARTAGRLDTALQLYRNALAKAPKGSMAVDRLERKTAEIQARLQKNTLASVAGKYTQAQQLMSTRRYVEAQALLEEIMPMVSGDEATSAVRRMLAEVHYAKAMAARDRVDEIQMQLELEKAIDSFNGMYKAHLAYGELLLKSSLTETRGMEEISKGIEFAGRELTGDERLKYHYLIGKRHFDKGQYEQAATNFVECLKVRSTSQAYSDALNMAVNSYIKLSEQSVMSDFDKTVANLTEALKLNPDNEDAHNLLGRMYKDAGQLDKAIESFTMVVRLRASYPNAYHYLAQAYRDKEDYDNALKNLDQELKNSPRNYDALVDRADVYIKILDYDKAATDLKSATELEPDKWNAYQLSAELAYAQERYDDARNMLMRVLQIKPDAIEAHVLMGKVFSADKKYDDAKLWFSNVVDYLSQVKNLTFKYRNIMAEAQTSLGIMDLEKDSPRQAETRFRQALEFIPTYGRALNKIGDVKRRLGNEAPDTKTKRKLYLEARDYYQEAILASPRDPDLYLSLGILNHKQLKDTQKAIENYKKYLTLGGKDRVTVEKWIEECEGPVGIDTTTTAAAGMSTDTLALDAATTGTTATLSAETATTGAAPASTAKTN